MSLFIFVVVVVVLQKRKDIYQVSILIFRGFRERKTPDRRGDTKNRITASLKDGPQPKKKENKSNLSPRAPSFPVSSLSLSLSFFPSRRERRARRKKTTTRRVHVRRAVRREEKKKALLLSAYLKISREEIGARERKRDNAPPSPLSLVGALRYGQKKKLLARGERKRKIS